MARLDGSHLESLEAVNGELTRFVLAHRVHPTATDDPIGNDFFDV